jgi:glycyl-tRNA synthetase beta chain
MTKKNQIENNHSILLEIGTEEIPARFLLPVMDSLKSNAEKIFNANRITFGSVITYATPRRISLIAEGVLPMQEASQKEIWGPPVNAAFDKNGKPAKAGEAFAAAHKVNVRDLLRKEKGKGTYVVAAVREDARPTMNILPAVLHELILSLNFPKSMRWGTGSLRFARPIHWILATYENKKVVFELGDIRSGNMTRGHRFLSPAAFEVKDVKSYQALLRNNFVVLDPEERRKIILEESEKLVSAVGACMVKDEDLLRHVTYLVEYPQPLMCSFPPDYLSLPKELLATVMKDHQKYFAVIDGQNNLMNCFIVVSNMRHDSAELVRKGAERVIKARFEDARFYFEEDRKITLKDRQTDLKKITFHEKLGNLFDKSLRIASISNLIAGRCRPERKAAVETASLSAKCDLISGVVREFPELQGIMGGYYALNDGLEPEVAKGISEHYLPSHSGGALPETDTGAIVSLADKLDNLTSFFTIGLAPSGTEDPFALRRQAMGVISILMDKRYDLSLNDLLTHEVPIDKKILKDLMGFLEQRLDFFLQSDGHPADAVSSVMGFAPDMPPYRIRELLEALLQARRNTEFDEFLLAAKRINNIAPKERVPAVNRKLFSQKEESDLYDGYEKLSGQLKDLLSTGQYETSLSLLLTLTGPINRFFDKVLIMDKDDQVRMNRLSLIKDVKTLIMQVSDFSRLTGRP